MSQMHRFWTQPTAEKSPYNKAVNALTFSRPVTDRIHRGVLLAIAGSAIAVYLWLLFRTNINWDEFHYLSQVYSVQQGRTELGLGNFHVILYGWLTRAGGTEIDQILIARVCQLALFSGALFFLYRLTTSVSNRKSGLISVFLVLTYSDMLVHAYSFRYDTICLFFTLLSIYAIWCKERWAWFWLGGASLAISTLISIKTSLYAPAFLGIAVIQITKPGEQSHFLKLHAGFLFAFSLVLLVGFGAQLVQGGEAIGNSDGIGRLHTRLSHIAYSMFFREGVFPQLDYFIRGLSQNSGHWILIGLGCAVALAAPYWRNKNIRNSMFGLVLVTPVLTVLVYRNAFPYFYVYVLPPAFVVAAAGIHKLSVAASKHSSRASVVIFIAPILFSFSTALMFLTLQHREGIAKQVSVLEAVHTLFPVPVAYLDAYGMVSSFPRFGPFMSTWGMRTYREKEEPALSRIIHEHEPKFLLNNHRAFFATPHPNQSDQENHVLLPTDREILKEAYIHHWGPIHVAGKHIRLPAEGQPLTFLIHISGPYTLEASEEVVIDRTKMKPGGTIVLEQGIHVISSGQPGMATLRWGGNFPALQREPAVEWLWDGL